MEKETKKARFKRVAEKRVQNVITGIRSLAGLSNKKVYEWETAQLDKIWKTFEKELEDLKEQFKDPDARIFKF